MLAGRGRGRIGVYVNVASGMSGFRGKHRYFCHCIYCVNVITASFVIGSL